MIYGICIGINCWTLEILNPCKLLALMFPFRMRNYRYRHGRYIAATMWIFQTPFSIVMTFAKGKLQNAVVSWATVSSIILTTVLFGSTFGILLIVLKARSKVKRKSMVPIFIVSVLYVVSMGPSIACGLMGLVDQQYAWAYCYSTNAAMPIIMHNSLLLTSFSNPIVYYFTIRSFKEYMDTLPLFRRPTAPAVASRDRVIQTPSSDDTTL